MSVYCVRFSQRIVLQAGWIQGRRSKMFARAQRVIFRSPIGGGKSSDRDAPEIFLRRQTFCFPIDTQQCRALATIIRSTRNTAEATQKCDGAMAIVLVIVSHNWMRVLA